MTFEFETTDLCDDKPGAVSVREPPLRSFGAKRRFHGTVRGEDDNALVVDGSERRAPPGNGLADIALERDLGGVVVNGCVRDSSDIEAPDVGVIATNPLKSRKEGSGETDVVVEFGGLTRTPGKDICADEDGVVTSRKPLP